MTSHHNSVEFARRLSSSSITNQLIILYCCIIMTSLSFSGTVIGVPVSKEESSTFQFDNESAPQEWRFLNGSGNNLANSEWGSTGDEVPNLTIQDFSNNFSSMAHSEFPNPRVISNALCEESQVKHDENAVSSINSLWAEFLRNDILLAPHQDSMHEGGMEEAHISIPVDDEILNPSGSETSQIRYIRTEFIEGSGTDENNPRVYPNQASAWIDASSIYGQNEVTNSWIRTQEGGQVIITDWDGSDMIPAYDSNGLISNWDDSSSIANIQFGAADSRNIDNIGVSTLHLLFLREHNRLADAIQDRNPDWSDEQIFQWAKKLVTAQIQVITYSEYLPSIGLNLPEYTGYNSSINPQVSNEFFLLVSSTFSSQRNDAWLLLNDSRDDISSSPLQLQEGYWTMEPILDDGVESIIRGAAYEAQRVNDLAMVSNLRNLLSGKSTWPGWIDECAMTIQLGRDRGLTDYNSVREGLGLERYLNWSNLTSDENVSSQLSETFDDIDNMDAIIGVLAEPRLDNSTFGETQHHLAFNQYTMLRDADRYWYANDPELTPLLPELNKIRLSDIILRNSKIESIQCDVFVVENNVDNFDCTLSNIEVVEPSVETDESPNYNYLLGVLLIVTIIAIVSVRGNSENDDNREQEEE